MTNFARKVILNSKSGYSSEHDSLLNQIIDDKVPLFCTVGKDCELWHDIMDEIFVGDGDIDRGFDQITTLHPGESLDEVIQFAKFTTSIISTMKRFK
jgi:hypothetical protein